MARKTGYQVSNGHGGWVDINEITDLDHLRRELIKAIDALEDIDLANIKIERAVERWRSSR